MEKRRDPLAGKRDPESCLYRAIRRYVESRGGNILVIGGIETQVWPGDLLGKYKVVVSCLGKKPRATPAATEVPK